MVSFLGNDYKKTKKWLEQLPMLGSGSFCLFNLHMSLDGGISSIVPAWGPETLNVFLLTSHIGHGYYVHKQKFIKRLPDERCQIIYTSYIILFHNFGSFVLSALIKDILPESKLIRTAFSLALSYVNLLIGQNIIKNLNNFN